MRSFFTLLSIMLIITLYTVLTSVGNSFTSQINRVTNQQDVDIAVQARYASSPVSSKISSAIVNEITNYKSVKDSESILISKKRVRGESSVFLLGVSNYSVFAQRLGFNIIEGRQISDKSSELVIGDKLSKVLNLGIGDKIKLDGGNEYIVTGIYSSWLNFLNSGIILDLELSQKLTGKKGFSSLLFLSLKDSNDTKRVVNLINNQFPEMRAIESLQLPDYMGPIKSVFFFSKIVSLLTLVIAVAVLLNTFIMAISERTKEIGILNAIGWPRSYIIFTILIESLLLSFVGGILGFITAYPVMFYLRNKFTTVYMFLPDSPSPDIFINVMFICFLVGLISTIFPAVYGTQIQVSKALHHE
ncbi:FtsX-like permease family protein [uncultured Cocleimonas sp.]|uniref:ABC transporter permease n=1 Tax=uncultured Cocleimonas sp. TaxID=1051587 RepID=UPI002608CE76|nr:FtsX-like permease family protein [uncultured Cocleimonas sp.]